MARFLKWGTGILIVIALTIATFLFFTHNNVVGNIHSSTTLSYKNKKENKKSVVMLEKDIDDKLTFNNNIVYIKPFGNKSIYQKYRNFMTNAKNVEIIRINNYKKYLKKQMERELFKEKLRQQKEMNSKKIKIVATAYTSNCKGCTGKTYTGYDVHHTVKYNGLNIIATDNNIIPLKSIVKIDTKYASFKAIVLDRGGGIKGNKIDLLVDTYNNAIKFGRQNVVVTILKEGKR